MSKQNGYANFDVNDKYKSGQWGSGSLSKQQLGEKYGLDTSAAENKGDTAVWGTNRSGERVFLGNIDNSFRTNDDVIQAHGRQADGGEINHSSKPEQVSSDGDVIGAMLNMWDGGGGAADAPETKEPFEPVGKSDDHKAAEENYDKHFEDGNPWDTTSAVDSYQSAFDRATAAGQDMTAGDYLRQRADDKKGGVNRFTHYLTDHNTLASHESHRSSMNAIKKAEYEDLEPPALVEPGNLYDRYKGDIDSI